MNAVARGKLDGLWSQLLATIAMHFEHYVLRVWPHEHQAALPPTSERRCRGCRDCMARDRQVTRDLQCDTWSCCSRPERYRCVQRFVLSDGR